jgi:hypothetical protein
MWGIDQFDHDQLNVGMKAQSHWFNPGRIHVDSWWSNWHRSRFFSESVRIFPVNHHSTIAIALIKQDISFACYLLHVGFLLGLFFYTEDEGNMFPRNVG